LKIRLWSDRRERYTDLYNYYSLSFVNINTEFSKKQFQRICISLPSVAPKKGRPGETVGFQERDGASRGNRRFPGKGWGVRGNRRFPGKGWGVRGNRRFPGFPGYI